MLDVGQHQLLVLLLVLHAECDALLQVRIIALRFQQGLHVQVDVLPVGCDFGQRRPRQQSALRPRVHVADGDVVGVEQVVVLLVETPVGGIEVLKHEALEKPGDVREMPLCRADVRHALDDTVLRRQVPAQRKAAIPHLPVGR